MNIKNEVICNDNLEVLKKIPTNYIDLIYIDPPFYTQKIKTSENFYNDIWKSFDDYIIYMKKIIKEIYRILKNTGSFYLHCDYHASHYLKIECDKLFGYDNFKNEITWKRNNTQNQQKITKFAVITDVILFYTKSNEYVFNEIKIPLNRKQIKRDYKNIERETNRSYSHHPLIKFGKSPKELYFIDKGKIIAPDNMRFIWNQKTYDEKIKKNSNIIYWTKNGKPRYKKYLDEHEGYFLNNLWDTILNVSYGSKKWVDYPTQKPEKLLERIIKVSSNEGDVILDCFCGSGTTCVVAKRLNRNYIGIDKNPRAIEITNKRLNEVISNNKNRFI